MPALNITFSGITMWHEICMGCNFHEYFRGVFIDLQKLNPMKTYGCQKKFRKNFSLLLTLLNFNETDCKQCNKKHHMASIFVTFKY